MREESLEGETLYGYSLSHHEALSGMLLISGQSEKLLSF
jgi:hypothetical protein